ncbi:conserved hypothetical protein [Agrobacterium fabacearum S56]|jgi:hypothetical protein|nr:conserved hypothetical protein [Agrobacterium fabacearum S56]
MLPRECQLGWRYGYLCDLAIDQLQRFDLTQKQCACCAQPEPSLSTNNNAATLDFLNFQLILISEVVFFIVRQ